MVIVTFKLFEFAKHLLTMSISVVCFYTDIPILDQADNHSHNKANTKMWSQLVADTDNCLHMCLH